MSTAKPIPTLLEAEALGVGEPIDLTPGELALCQRLGLIDAEGRITHAGRVLLGEKPPRPEPESIPAFLARLEAIKDGKP